MVYSKVNYMVANTEISKTKKLTFKNSHNYLVRPVNSSVVDTLLIVDQMPYIVHINFL